MTVIGEAAPDRGPDEVGKSPVGPLKGVLIGLQTAENLT
jgi:hypothetical protein